MTISLSLSTRSRLVVAWVSTPEHGLAAIISCRTAQLKIGLAAARTWFAYVEEITAKEPAELPRGHLNQNRNVNENINSTTIEPRQ